MLRLFLGVLWGIVMCGAIVCVLALGALRLGVNFDQVKPQIEAQATALLQQRVHIGGDIRPGVLGWRPALVMHKVDIGLRVHADTVALAMQGAHASQGYLIHAEGIKYNNYPVGDYDLPVTLQPDGFDIYPLRGALNGAVLAGQVKYVGNKLHIEGVLKDLPLSKLAEEAEGKVDGTFKLEGTGDSSAQLIRTLDGRFVLTSSSGRLTSKSLNFWSRDVLTSFLPVGKDETTLNCAIIDFDIQKGMAVSRALVIDTNENTIIAKGRIDLDKQTINMLLRPNPKDLSLVSVATPILITGPFGNTVVTPQAGGMVKRIGGILLDVVNPAFMLLPVLERGMDEYHGSCADIIKQHQPKKTP